MLILLRLILAALDYCYKPVGQVIIGDLGNNDDSGVRSLVSGDLLRVLLLIQFAGCRRVLQACLDVFYKVQSFRWFGPWTVFALRHLRKCVWECHGKTVLAPIGGTDITTVVV